MTKIRIVPPEAGGTGQGTRILTEDGQELQGVTEINIRIAAKELITATVKVLPQVDEVTAQLLLDHETLEASAAALGLKLVEA